MSDISVVIVTGARTPMGGFQGALATIPAPELGATAVKAACERANLDDDSIDEVLMGCVLPAGLGQAPARQAALKAGLSVATCCTTINKMCGSGMKATLMAHDQIKAGSSRVAIAGGMESMSLAPYILPKVRQGLRIGHAEMKDHMFFDGLEDAYNGRLMGSLAQEVADRYQITREDMDNYAIESLHRAQKAIDEGWFEDEITPVIVKGRGGEVSVAQDEQPGNARIEKIPQLKPAFKKDGTITAANASSISDGAAALVLMSDQEASARGLSPMARIVAHASCARHPDEFSFAPNDSIVKVLEKAGWSLGEVDLFEVNEAFASVPLLSIKELGIPRDKINIQGGACALGHPVGASGARIILTLMHSLRRLGLKKGVASLCIGGGEATAIAIAML